MARAFRRPEATEDRDLVVRTDHESPRFLVSPGWGAIWVHCPVCGAMSDGWDPAGRPTYTGGTILAETPRPPSAQFVEVVAACRCARGERFHEATGALHFDELPSVTVFLTRPMHVLWARGKSAGYPPRTDERRNSEEYGLRMGEQFRRVMRGEITHEQFLENSAAIAKRLMPEWRQGPTIEDLMQSTALMDLYLPDRSKKLDKAAMAAQER